MQSSITVTCYVVSVHKLLIASRTEATHVVSDLRTPIILSKPEEDLPSKRIGKIAKNIDKNRKRLRNVELQRPQTEPAGCSAHLDVTPCSSYLRPFTLP